MSCCGDKRNNWLDASQKPSGFIPDVSNRVPIIVKYLGKDKMTIIGTASRKNYQFSQQGEQVMIDSLDLAAFENHLKIEIISKLNS